MTKTIFDLIKEVADKDRKTVEQTALKLMEECGEVAEAILSFENAPACGYKGKSLDDIIEECCDVIIVAYTIAGSKYKIPKSVIEDRLAQKLIKWDKKIEMDTKPQPVNDTYIIEISHEQASKLADSTRLLVRDGARFREGVIQESLNKEVKIVRAINSSDYYVLKADSKTETRIRFYVSLPVAIALQALEK